MGFSGGLALGFARGLDKARQRKEQESKGQQEDFKSLLLSLANNPATPDEARNAATEKYFQVVYSGGKAIKQKDYQNVLGGILQMTQRPNVQQQLGGMAQQQYDQTWGQTNQAVSQKLQQENKSLPGSELLATTLQGLPGVAGAEQFKQNAEQGPPAPTTGLPPGGMDYITSQMLSSASNMATDQLQQQQGNVQQLEGLQQLIPQRPEMPAGAGMTKGLMTPTEMGVQQLLASKQAESLIKQMFPKEAAFKEVKELKDGSLVAVYDNGEIKSLREASGIGGGDLGSKENDITGLLQIANLRRASAGKAPLNPTSTDPQEQQEYLDTWWKARNESENIGKISQEVTQLRKNYTAETKEVRTSLTAYAVAKRAYQQYEEDKAAGRPNLSAKITLLYSYIKALDPGSVVREGEVQLTKTNQLFGDTLAIKDDLINKTGKAMSDTQMKSLMREMDILNQVNMSNWQSVSMDYTERAKGLNEFTVTHPYRVEDIIASPADPEVLAEFLGANTKNAAASQVRNAMRQWSMGNSSAINELIVPQEPAPDTAPAAGNASWLPTLSPEDTRSALSQVGVGQQTQPQQTPTTAPAATPPPTQYDGLIQQAAQKYNIHPALLSAVMQKESATRPDAVSPAGAIGLMQIMPDTGRDLGYTPEQLRDPAINIEAGAKYLKQLLDQFGGDAELALAAYNSGMGNVRKYGNKVPPFKETQDYVASLAPIAKTFGTNYIEQLAQRSGIPVFIEDGQ